jgi:hypothetical protein
MDRKSVPPRRRMILNGEVEKVAIAADLKYFSP